MQKFALFAFVACVLVVGSVTGNYCIVVTPENYPPIEYASWDFGIQDSVDSASAPFEGNVYKGRNEYDIKFYQNQGYLNNLFTYQINGVPLMGGINNTDYDSSIVRTASFICETDYSATWGPVYASHFGSDGDVRGSYPDLEVNLHYSAPNQTSYMRNILYIKNTGSKRERVSLAMDWLLDDNYGFDISPNQNDGRYYTIWPWQEGDLGQNGIRPFVGPYPQSTHARGPKSRVSNSIMHVDIDNWVVSPTYYTELEPDQEMALMFIVSVGINTTNALKNAVAIDAEPAYIFHDLNADQLSLIRNWGGCEVILGPEVSVAINAPSQCSSGFTSEFTVTATATRNDLNTGFTHRVVIRNSKTEIVPAQSSTTISVLNGVGQVAHQLWYKECLVKETDFTACEKLVTLTTVPVTQPSHVSSASSFSLNLIVVSVFALFVSLTGHTRSTSTMIVVVCIIGLLFVNNGVSAQVSSCTDVAVGETGARPIQWYFGLDNGGGSPLYYTYLSDSRWSPYDYYVYSTGSVFSENFFNFGINSVPLTGAKNYTTYASTATPTASFKCDTDYSGLWGPAYPDYRDPDFDIRGQFQNLEAYVHYSAPSETSYVRAVLFMKNVGTTSERVRISADWTVSSFGNDISPLNGGRYFIPFPWQDGDKGRDGTNPAANYNGYFNSLHVRGPKARDEDSVFVCEYHYRVLSPAYYTTLDAGKEMAMMYIVSYGTNRTTTLESAAKIDTEPAQLFHNLNADQLSLIRNWGTCQSVLAPEVSVTVNAPSQCSSGSTSEFTVTAMTTRNDFTVGFTHRVVLATLRNYPIVPTQSSATLTVPNGAGALVHQLWYKECLIKETTFNACA